MLSLRNLARSVPRAITRASAQSSARPFTSLWQFTRVQQPWRTASIPRLAAFSTSSPFRAETSEGLVDQELSAKLEDELQMEKEMSDSTDLAPSLKEFMDSSAFQIHDTPGEEEVVLTRSFGNEKIRITFSIADLNSIDPEAYAEDKAQFDENEDLLPEDLRPGNSQSDGAQSKGTTAHDALRSSEADQENVEDESPATDEEPSFPARMNITIEKDGVAGALQVETVAQDGVINIENVYYFKQSDLADAKTAEHDWSRRLMYTGPPYGNLDQDLQVLLERYLDERGINTALALWVPEYIDYKEQKEYLNWLSDVKSFVDA